MAIEYEEYSYYDMINKLNIKAEELYSMGIINVQLKNYVNEMKKQLDKINTEAFINLTEYSENLVKDKNSEYYDENYDNILDKLADNCFIFPKSGVTPPDVSSMVKGDRIDDGQLVIEKIEYNIFDSEEYPTVKETENAPYKDRISSHNYYLEDIYNIGNASFKVVGTNGN